MITLKRYSFNTLKGVLKYNFKAIYKIFINNKNKRLT